MDRNLVAVILVLAVALGALALQRARTEAGPPALPRAPAAQPPEAETARPETTVARAGDARTVDALPAGQLPARPAPGTRYYVVEPGDTLFSIARRHGTTVRVLQDLNGIENPDLIRVGQVIRVPAPAQEGPATPDAPAVPALSTGRLASAPAAATPEERHLLASIIWLEARGEPFEGQVAVGAVVLNRVRHPSFPDTIAGVLMQPGQFPFSREMLLSTRPGPTALAAADRALAGEDPTGGALYFYNPEKTATPEFWATRPVLLRIGRHVFTL